MAIAARPAVSVSVSSSAVPVSVSSSAVSSQTNVNSNSRKNRRRVGRPAGMAPYLMLVLLVVASTSFFHSVVHVSSIENTASNTDHNRNHNHHNEQGQDHDNSNGNSNALEASLKDFRQTSRKKKQRTKKQLLLSEEEEEDLESINEHEDPIDNPTSNNNDNSNGNETFSACLLVMDDNHRLVEWMAYHYHVLPLRYLVVAVDPRSKTSPTKILNRWRQMGVTIEEWDDFRFLKKEIARNVVSDGAELQIKRDRHRIRQKNFYQTCLRHLKEKNRTYTTLIDTDEFVMYNHYGGPAFEEWEALQQKLHDESRFSENIRIKPSQPPPTTAQAGALIQYIRQEQAAGWEFFRRPCLSCPRLQFGAKESSVEERSKNVPTDNDSNNNDHSVVNSDRLDTLRFRKHAERQDYVKNGLAKTIVDVSRVEKFPRVQSLHRPIKTICTAPWKDEWNSGLRINHYLGSWEAYSYRDDSRRGGERSYEGWAFKAQDADETDDNIRPWIGGFVQEHGMPKAKELLQGAGLPRGYSKGNGNWTIMFLDEILGMNETKGNDMRVAFDNFVRDFHFNKNQSTEGLL